MEKYTNIYILIDPRNNLVRYVGKTNNIKKRYRAHNNITRDKSTHKRNWINELKNIGLKPLMEVIDVVYIDDWPYWESYWINQMKVWGFKLVNSTTGGDGTTFGNSGSFKKNERGKAVSAYDKNYNIIYEFNSAREATTNLGGHKSIIPGCASGKFKTYKGLSWFYKSDIINKNLKLLIDNRFTKNINHNSGNFKKGQISERSKSIIITDVITGIVNKFNSSTEAAGVIGVSQATVSRAANSGKLFNKKKKLAKYEN